MNNQKQTIYISDRDLLSKTGQYPKYLGIRVSAWKELAVFFVITILLALTLGRHDLFFSVCPHPFWIIVILLSVQYGTNEGLVAACAATVILLLGHYPEKSLFQDKYSYFLSIALNPILWFVSAAILGEIRLRHIRERDRLKEIALEADSREKTISEAYNQLKAVKEKQDIKIASEMQTALMAYEALKNLETMDLDSILKGGLELMKGLIFPEKCSLYLLESDQLMRIAQEGWSANDMKSIIYPSNSRIFQEVIGNQKTISVLNEDEKMILANEGLLAAPIKSSINPSAVFGMLKVEALPFLRLRLNTIQILRQIGEWVGTAYEAFQAKTRAERDSFIDEKSQLLSSRYLEHQKEFLGNLGRRLKINLVIFYVSVRPPEGISSSEKIQVMQLFRKAVSENLRTVDQAFEYKKEDLEFAILLLNTSLQNCEIVKNKLVNELAMELGKEFKINYRFEPLYLYEKKKEE